MPVELSPCEGGAGDEYESVQVTEYSAIGLEPAGPVYCLSLRYQIAQKIHACTDPLDGTRPNDRARDLVDLQLLGPLVDDTQHAAIREACVEVFHERQRHQWPPHVRVWPAWPDIYIAATAALDEDVLPDVDEAAAWLRALIHRLDTAIPLG